MNHRESPLSLHVIGYYGHYNLGDEQYRQTFTKLFKDYLTEPFVLHFHDCDRLHMVTFAETDIIILGGGDVLNSYFLDTINHIFGNRNNLVVAISVGLPYTETLVTTDKLDRIDYIFLRTTIDLELFNNHFYTDRVFYLPDISILLTQPPQHLEQNTKTTSCVKNKESVHFDYSFKKRLQKLEPFGERKVTFENGDQSPINIILRLSKSGSKIASVCLSRHVYRSGYETEYETFTTGMSQLVNGLVDRNYTVVFVPFNTNPDAPNENDIIIANDVLQKVQHRSKRLCINITETISVTDTLQILKHSNLCIPMRFHACLFAIYSYTPIIPVYTTRKIQNLLTETGWLWSYHVPTNTAGIPIQLDADVIFDQLTRLTSRDTFRENNYNKLLHINKNALHIMFRKTIARFIEIITLGNRPLRDRSIQTRGQRTVIELYETVQEFAKTHGYDDYRHVQDPNLRDLIVCIIAYNLTGGTINSIYNWGLYEKIYNSSEPYDYAKEWSWIVNDHISKHVPRTDTLHSRGLFNMDYIDQIDYSGAHRSGWQYVYKHIQYMHSTNNDILLDLYIDRTFHWNKTINRVLDIIPYKTPWIGFVHHTFDTSFSEYNCHNLLKSQEFLESLKSCLGLFVLSEYLQRQFLERLKNININVPVYKLTHPTECDVKRFSYRAFFENPKKRLIHVGGWLRNVYSFYNLNIPETTQFRYGFLVGHGSWIPLRKRNDRIHKVALRGKNMNNYYPDSNLTDTLKYTLENAQTNRNSIIVNKNISQNISTYPQNTSQNISNTQNQNISQNISASNTLTNNWNKHFYQDLCNKFQDVEFIEYLDNSAYDDLLTENIVFINLVDASAVNTVIECIVRQTPIIVNNHPAIVEILGKNYPLYFRSHPTDYFGINREINNMLMDDSKIRSAHNYLRRRSQKPFRINTFTKQFERALREINKSFEQDKQRQIIEI